MSALGFIETSGRLGAIVATDIALKTANVRLISLSRTSGGLITLIIKGDVAAVHSAIEKARKEAKTICTYVTANIIAQPAADILTTIEMLSKKEKKAFKEKKY
ncbi:MAG: BMC domain-containing protein [Candidatus Heimdallarchaeota archaeon]|nr:MAG: BMC domain-containing protein [Candidatus Heimdallarchaeota archaeon]